MASSIYEPCSLVFSLPYTCASVVTAMLLFHAGCLCVHGGRGRNRRTWKGGEIWCLCGDGKTVFVDMQRSRENKGKVSVIRQRQRLNFEDFKNSSLSCRPGRVDAGSVRPYMVYSARSSHLVFQSPLTQPISITYAFLTPSSNPLQIFEALGWGVCGVVRMCSEGPGLTEMGGNLERLLR